MMALTPRVFPILATPFGVVALPEAERRNAELATLFTARAASGAGAGATSDSLCYHSRDDLLEWPEPEVRDVTREMLRGVYAVVATLNEFSAAQLESFELQARAWFTVVQPDGGVSARIQPLTSWCGVYCVSAPERPPTRRDSGVLRLYESRLGTMFPDATNSLMRLPFTPGHSAWLPVPGELAVFPASVLHEIAPLRATAPLVLVMLRVRFVAPGQQGWVRW
jgi:hypothetical protein